MSTRTYKIGEVAKLAGISIRTLRYYDAIGLLKPGKAQANGHRQYDERDIEKLQLILGLKVLGFSLDDIQTYLEKPDVDLVDVLTYQKELLTNKINAFASINSRIDFIIGQYRESGERKTADIFSLYGMMQMANHNEIMKKYFPALKQPDIPGDAAYSPHAALDKALEMLTKKTIRSIAPTEQAVVVEAFREFIRDCFGTVTKQTIGKTTRMLAEITAGNENTLATMQETDVRNWLCANLIGQQEEYHA